MKRLGKPVGSFMAALIICLGPVRETSAVLEFLGQTGSAVVHGELGTFVSTAPADRPWLTTVNADAGGPIWFAQSFVATNWTPRTAGIYAEALVEEGTTPGRLTQSITDLSLEFRLPEPVTLLFDFSAFPNDIDPGTAVDVMSMRFADALSGAAIAEGIVRNRAVLVPSGRYRLEASNHLGNTLDQLSLPAGARMLGLLVNEVLPGDANQDNVVDGTDFGIWNANKFTQNTDWRSGDFNGDGLTDGADFNIWNAHKFHSADRGQIVPEPSEWFILIWTLCVAPSLARR